MSQLNAATIWEREFVYDVVLVVGRELDLKYSLKILNTTLEKYCKEDEQEQEKDIGNRTIGEWFGYRTGYVVLLQLMWRTWEY